jgi:CheY-like chemotaxis protein
MLLLLRTFLSTFAEDIEVVGVATGAEEALEAWRRTQPDMIVLDNRMPGRTGLEVAAEILAEDERQGIILFTAVVDAEVEDRASEIGVCQVVGKDRFRELPDVIRGCQA